MYAYDLMLNNPIFKSKMDHLKNTEAFDIIVTEIQRHFSAYQNLLYTDEQKALWHYQEILNTHNAVINLS